jgi:hypothetical protein
LRIGPNWKRMSLGTLFELLPKHANDDAKPATAPRRRYIGPHTRYASLALTRTPDGRGRIMQAIGRWLGLDPGF